MRCVATPNYHPAPPRLVHILVRDARESTGLRDLNATPMIRPPLMARVTIPGRQARSIFLFFKPLQPLKVHRCKGNPM
jgi:hypothetical protein